MKLIGAGQAFATRMHSSSLAFSSPPAQVIQNGAAEQHVLLQHHGHLAAQHVEVVVAHIHAAHLHGAGLGIIQAGDQLHKAGFCTAGAADDT